MYKILVTGSIHQIGLEILRKEKDIEIQYAPDLPLPEIFKIIAPFHCILTRSETPISKELIDKAPKLKVIARAAVGIGNIDVKYATEKGILVINTPGKNTNSAAELTIGHRTARKNNWHNRSRKCRTSSGAIRKSFRYGSAGF